MRAGIRKAMLRVGRRGASLAFFALIHAAIALSLARMPTAAPLRTELLLPVGLWWTAWATSATICLAGAIFATFDAIAFGASMYMMIAWSAISFYAFALHPTAIGWLSGVIWFCFAGFVWVISGWVDPDDPRRRRHPP